MKRRGSSLQMEAQRKVKKWETAQHVQISAPKSPMIARLQLSNFDVQ